MAPDLRYPIGDFAAPTDITPARISSWIDDIEVLPRDLRALVAPLDSGQLATAYRPEGWTVAQVSTISRTAISTAACDSGWR